MQSPKRGCGTPHKYDRKITKMYSTKTKGLNGNISNLTRNKGKLKHKLPSLNSALGSQKAEPFFSFQKVEFLFPVCSLSSFSGFLLVLEIQLQLLLLCQQPAEFSWIKRETKLLGNRKKSENLKENVHKKELSLSENKSVFYWIRQGSNYFSKFLIFFKSFSWFAHRQPGLDPPRVK